MFKSNYHSHTFYCDGSNAPEDYVKSAISLGVQAYGFSSHAPVPFSTEWCIADDKIFDYLNAINNLKDKYIGQIEIYTGLEIDFMPGICGRKLNLLREIELDYFIGSIHFVDQTDDGKYWNIDTSIEEFQRGLEGIFKNDIKAAVKRFYELTRMMITVDKPDIIGHVDKIKMFNNSLQLFDEDAFWYKNEIIDTLDLIAQLGTIVEVNTRGLYRYGQKDLYPSKKILEYISAKKIPVMINSDCHSPSEIISGLDFANSCLLSVGIKEVSVLRQNKWQTIEIAG